MHATQRWQRPRNDPFEKHSPADRAPHIHAHSQSRDPRINRTFPKSQKTRRAVWKKWRCIRMDQRCVEGGLLSRGSDGPRRGHGRASLPPRSHGLRFGPLARWRESEIGGGGKVKAKSAPLLPRLSLKPWFLSLRPVPAHRLRDVSALTSRPS